MDQLGRLERIDPRAIWQHEAHNFTPWLLLNADRLAEALGIDLELEATEHAVGGFSLDLVGKDITNDAVLIVENQLAPTDHSHLGQVLTYAAGTGAATIVWIATSFRDEHRQALDWLNENTGDRTHFFGIELELVQIGESVPAPLLNLVAQPNDWQKQVRASTQAAGAGRKGALYVEFWGRLLDRVQAQHPDWTKSRRAVSDNWFDMRAPIRDCRISLSFARDDRLRHELYIDTGDADRNMELFLHVRDRQSQVEAEYGRVLFWEELPNRQACRIADYKEGCSVTDEGRYDEYIDWFIDAGVRLRNALGSVALPL